MPPHSLLLKCLEIENSHVFTELIHKKYNVYVNVNNAVHKIHYLYKKGNLGNVNYLNNIESVKFINHNIIFNLKYTSSYYLTYDTLLDYLIISKPEIYYIIYPITTLKADLINEIVFIFYIQLDDIFKYCRIKTNTTTKLITDNIYLNYNSGYGFNLKLEYILEYLNNAVLDELPEIPRLQYLKYSEIRYNTPSYNDPKNVLKYILYLDFNNEINNNNLRNLRTNIFPMYADKLKFLIRKKKILNNLIEDCQVK